MLEDEKGHPISFTLKTNASNTMRVAMANFIKDDLAKVGIRVSPAPLEFNTLIANLREDVRGLTQRVGELSLRLEQLERENAELRQRSNAAGKSYATVSQLSEAVADMARDVRASVAASKNETLQHVSAQLEKLGKQTNAALESLAKTQPAKSVPQSSW